MKKRTKEILASVLAMSILLGTPAYTKAVEVRQEPTENRAEIFSESLPEETESVSESFSEVLPEKQTENRTEIYSEVLPEQETESASEIYSESLPEETESVSEPFSEIISEETSQGKSEIMSEETSEAYPELISHEITQTDRTIENSAMRETDKAVHGELYVSSQVSDGGELDYRTYMDRTAYIQTTVRKSAEGRGADFLAGINYQIRIDDTSVADFKEAGSTLRYGSCAAVLTTQQSSVPLKINGVGETKYTVTVSGVPGYDTASYSGRIKVMDSPLYDSDFYIELASDGQIQQYEYDAWMDFLQSTDEWLNDKAEVKLSDTGKRYFSSVEIKEQKVSDAQESAADHVKKNYIFWAENLDRNASTKDVENGTRSYTAGMDTKAPALKDFCVDSECYEPTKTETEQYFAEDFVLHGTYLDDASGVSRIEYTTNLRAEKDAVWMEAEITRHLETQNNFNSTADFRIALPDGRYPAVAVRAYDTAGNVSEVKQYVNEAGKEITVVVDSKAPALKIVMSADGQPYSGRDENWINRDVRIEVAPDRDSCAYAGIYRYEYTYMKIGENMTDVSEKWTKLPVQDDSLAVLDVTEDRNGYYLFRAVSKSGVETEEDIKQRILIQRQIAEIKPPATSGADETKCRDGWYNKQSGTPVIRFEYPEYDNGSKSKEYDAPITIHYQLTKTSSDSALSDEGEKTQAADSVKKSAVIGVMDCEDLTMSEDGSKCFTLTKDDLNQHIVEFGQEDGFYTLEYWITDRAGNESAKQVYSYKIDCHEPTGLTMYLDGSEFAVGDNTVITYDRFYRDTVSGSAKAQYGISGKGSIKVKKVKKIGEWQDAESDSMEDADNISISPNIRCFLYIRAEDAAGNVAEGWTNGIVVDNMAPNEAGSGKGQELIIEPKGANAHGFFNDDITVEINVQDAPEDNNCAALKSVSGSVGRDGADTIADYEFFSFDKESPTEDEMTAASTFQCVQLVDAGANESREAYIEVTAVDRSGNVKTSAQLLKIDVTKPEIDIRFDNMDVSNGSYYRQGRTATIHVHELNFNPDAVSVSVTKNGQQSEVSLSGWTDEGSDHYATIAFAEDGEYSIVASCVDLADNVSDEAQSGTFIIDRTAPEMTIGLSVREGSPAAAWDCFNASVTAVITVTERNFCAEDFVINMTPVSEKGVWSHEGDVHTLRVLFGADGAYHIDCAYTDLAGNSAVAVEKDFVVDTIAPAIAIEGVADGSANSGAILPVISVLDQNIEISGISVSVMTGLGDGVTAATETELFDEGGASRYRMALTDMTEKPDNVYYLTVSACDRAGNRAELTYRFSLNRNGSVYDLTSLMQLIQNQYNTYGSVHDIRIVEMNIDTVEEFALYVSRNGTIGYAAEYTKEVSGSADIGYTYIYQVKSENFAEEGIYRLSLYSRDRAGNEVSNVNDIHGDAISFVIDNTAPKVIIDGVRSGMMYDTEEQEVHVSVTDNFKLAEAQFILVDKENDVLKSWDYMELAGEGEALTICIPQYHEEMSLLYKVKDAAGNEMQTFPYEQEAVSGFLVTTNRFVQLINKPSKTPLGRILIFMTGVSGAAALPASTVAIRRKKRRKL